MQRTHSSRYLALAVLCAGLASCSESGLTDPTDPSSPAALPGKRLLASGDYHAWAWYPAGSEVVYTTRWEYPYTGPQTRIEAVSLSTGKVRTIVAAAPGGIPGGSIIETAIGVYGSFVYFSVARPSTDTAVIFRASLSAAAAPEKLFEGDELGFVAPSPDGTMLAWANVSSGLPRITTIDLATHTRRDYALQRAALRVHWSPSGRAILADDGSTYPQGGAPVQLLTIRDATVRMWITGLTAISDVSETFGPVGENVSWDGDSPIIYAAGGKSLDRYLASSGTTEHLAFFSTPGSAVGWATDFRSVVIAETECVKFSDGIIFGATCTQYAASADRVNTETGASTNLFQLNTRAPAFLAADPTLTWLAYVYYSNVQAIDGLYVLSMPR